VLMNITGGEDMSIIDINEAAQLVMQAADGEANIIFGAGIDEALKDEVRITVIATGFERTQFPPKAQIKRDRMAYPPSQSPYPPSASLVHQQAPPQYAPAAMEDEPMQEQVPTPAFSRYDPSYTPVIEPFAAPREEAMPSAVGDELPSFINTARTPPPRTSPFQKTPAFAASQGQPAYASDPEPEEEEPRGFTPDVPAYLRRPPKK